MMNNDSDFPQHEKNSTLESALRSMMLESYTHIVVRRRVPGYGMEPIGGGTPASVIRRFGSFEVERSLITHEGVLQVTVR